MSEPVDVQPLRAKFGMFDLGPEDQVVTVWKQGSTFPTPVLWVRTTLTNSEGLKSPGNFGGKFWQSTQESPTSPWLPRANLKVDPTEGCAARPSSLPCQIKLYDSGGFKLQTPVANNTWLGI
eukprot:5658672-Amphidinium_carterae.2